MRNCAWTVAHAKQRTTCTSCGMGALSLFSPVNREFGESSRDIRKTVVRTVVETEGDRDRDGVDETERVR